MAHDVGALNEQKKRVSVIFVPASPKWLRMEILKAVSYKEEILYLCEFDWIF